MKLLCFSIWVLVAQVGSVIKNCTLHGRSTFQYYVRVKNIYIYDPIIFSSRGTYLQCPNEVHVTTEFAWQKSELCSYHVKRKTHLHHKKGSGRVGEMLKGKVGHLRNRTAENFLLAQEKESQWSLPSIPGPTELKYPNTEEAKNVRWMISQNKKATPDSSGNFQRSGSF